MKKTIFTGSGVAIVTPMDKSGNIDYPELAKLIEFQIANETDCIVICGTTGESSTLTDEEHIELIRYTVEKTAKRVPVIAGTGSNDTAYSLMLSKEAAAVGADALLQVTPYYNKTSQRGLVQHFLEVANNVDLPMMLYNVPSRTGMTISVDAYKELAKHPNIVATKEASGDLSLIAKIAAAVGDSIDIYSGNDDQIVPIMSLGGKGVVSVAANIVPKAIHDIAALYLDGKTTESRDMQLKYLGLLNSLFLDVNPIPVKTAVNLIGFKAGNCRLPLVDLDVRHLNVLKEEMQKHNLI